MLKENATPKENDTFVYIWKRKGYFCIHSQKKMILLYTFANEDFFSASIFFGFNYLIKETKPWNTKLIILFVINNSKNLRKSGKNNLPQYSSYNVIKELNTL